MSTNHSRDRHGSIFDGAEWDELWSVKVRLGDVRSVDAGRGALMKPLSRSAWCVFDGAERDVSSRGRSWFVELGLGWLRHRKETTYTVGVAAASMLHGGMGHGVLGSCSMWQCGFGQCWSCHGNHHRAGTEADQRGRGGMSLVVSGMLVPGLSMRVLSR
jgi:hypothetical protein